MRVSGCIVATLLLVTGDVSAGATETSSRPGGSQALLPASVDPAAQFVRANEAYQSGDFAKAATLYEQLLAQGTDDGHISYNLGNAYLRAGNLGAAIANYRRASSLLPRDADLMANLDFARNSVRDAIEPPQSAAILRTLFFWYFNLSLGEMVKLLLVFNLLFWGVLAVRLFRRDSELLRWLVYTFLGLWLVLGMSAGGRLFSPARVAVMLKPAVSVHTGTSRDTVVRFKLHAGTETEWVDSHDGWVRIALPDGKQGWVEAQSVVTLEL